MSFRNEQKPLYTIQWVPFLKALEGWKTLSPKARRKLVQVLDSDAGVPLDQFGDESESIRQSGLVEQSPMDQQVALKKEYEPFIKILKDSPDTPPNATSAHFFDYFKMYFQDSQISSFFEWTNYDLTWVDVLESVTNVEWVMDFLNKKSGITWEKPFHKYNEPYYFSQPEIVKITKGILHYLLKRKEPVPIYDVFHYLKQKPEKLNDALNAGLRYLLFYFTVEPNTREPVLFVWPRIIQRIDNPTPSMPQPIPPSGEAFSASFRLQDLTTILIECSIEPFRARIQDLLIYDNIKKKVDEKIVPIPDWIYSISGMSMEERTDAAVNVARHLNFLKLTDSVRSTYLYEITFQGQEWLTGTLKERIKTCLSPLRSMSLQEWWLQRLNFYRFEPKNSNSATVLTRLSQNMENGFRLLQEDSYYPLNDFLDYLAIEHNPLLQMLKEEKNFLQSILRISKYRIKPSSLETIWRNTIYSMLFHMLLPWGGIRLCRQPDGAILFALSEIGQYVFGFRTDFEMVQEETNVVVQPNFEVVFLAPSVQAEAVFSRFAERTGQGMGTLFRISKKSIQRAVELRIALEEIETELKRLSRKEIPQNVQHEIREWYSSCRRISSQPVVLLTCPDEATADLVRAKAGPEAKPVSDRVVALPRYFDSKKLYSKLREMGVFVEKKEE